MNPNEIKKALECHIKGVCNDCPLQNIEHCMRQCYENALAYINQLEAEVERLKGIVNADVAFVGMRSGKSEKVKQIMMLRAKEIKSEAIEDFRQRVNKKMGKHTSYLGKEYVQRIMREVKKEMVGDEE